MTGRSHRPMLVTVPGSDDLSPAVTDVPRCVTCGDVIGVYEPMVHVRAGVARRTSRAAEPHLCRSGEPCFHEGCYHGRDGTPD
jgi:hypothetical protein